MQASANAAANFIAGGAAAKVGDYLAFVSDGTNWYVSGASQTTTAITFTA